MFYSKDDEKVLDKLVKEVRGLNPTFNSAGVSLCLSAHVHWRHTVVTWFVSLFVPAISALLVGFEC